MRTGDIVIGEFYQLKAKPSYGIAQALEIMKPKPDYLCKSELEKQIKNVVVRCKWMLTKNDMVALEKYFKPADLQKYK